MGAHMEQWKQDLNDLIRQPPGRDVKGVVQRIMRSKLDDRSTALTCAAFAEIGLAAGIAMVLQPDRDQVIDWFWKPVGKHGRGKYGSFRQEKISAALDLDLSWVRIQDTIWRSYAAFGTLSPIRWPTCDLPHRRSRPRANSSRARRTCRRKKSGLVRADLRIAKYAIRFSGFFLAAQRLSGLLGAKPQQRLLP